MNIEWFCHEILPKSRWDNPRYYVYSVPRVDSCEFIVVFVAIDASENTKTPIPFDLPSKHMLEALCSGVFWAGEFIYDIIFSIHLLDVCEIDDATPKSEFSNTIHQCTTHNFIKTHPGGI